MDIFQSSSSYYPIHPQNIFTGVLYILPRSKKYLFFSRLAYIHFLIQILKHHTTHRNSRTLPSDSLRSNRSGYTIYPQNILTHVLFISSRSKICFFIFFPRLAYIHSLIRILTSWPPDQVLQSENLCRALLFIPSDIEKKKKITPCFYILFD